MTRFALDRHKRAARAVGYALTANLPVLWHDLSLIFIARLTGVERAALAFAALRSLDPEDRERIFEAAHRGHTDGG
jgi:hypothetical protein